MLSESFQASADDCHGPDLPPDGGAAAAPAAEPVDAEAAVPATASKLACRSQYSLWLSSDQGFIVL